MTRRAWRALGIVAIALPLLMLVGECPEGDGGIGPPVPDGGRLSIQPRHDAGGLPELDIRWSGPGDSLTHSCMGRSPCVVPQRPGPLVVHIYIWRGDTVWAEVVREFRLVADDDGNLGLRGT